MNERNSTQPLEDLRRRVARLEEDNRRLRGRGVPSRAAVELARSNAQLRRCIAAEMPRPAGRGGRDYLTIQQAAQELNVPTVRLLRDLRDSLPLAADAEGKLVVARRDLDALLLARAEGRSTRRFL